MHLSSDSLSIISNLAVPVQSPLTPCARQPFAGKVAVACPPSLKEATAVFAASNSNSDRGDCVDHHDQKTRDLSSKSALRRRRQSPQQSREKQRESNKNHAKDCVRNRPRIVQRIERFLRRPDRDSCQHRCSIARPTRS